MRPDQPGQQQYQTARLGDRLHLDRDKVGFPPSVRKSLIARKDSPSYAGRREVTGSVGGGKQVAGICSLARGREVNRLARKLLSAIAFYAAASR